MRERGHGFSSIAANLWVTCRGSEHALPNALADFVMAIQSGRPAQLDLRIAVQTQTVFDAVLESARIGRSLETGVPS